MAEAMLPVELEEVTDPLEEGDELLTADELASLSLFEDLKKTPSFARFPGTTVLRKCKKGRALVRQGEGGATAYSILSSEDVLELRESQLASIKATLQAQEAGEEAKHMYYANESPKSLRATAEVFEEEIASLRERVTGYESAGTDPEDRQVATAHLIVNFDKNRKPGLIHRLGRMFSGGARKRSRPDRIPIDGPSDIDTKTKQAPLHESELFGEMSCMNRAPRSATVVAGSDATLFVLGKYQLEGVMRKNRDMEVIISRNVIATLAQRIRQSNEELNHLRGLIADQGAPTEEVTEEDI